MVATNDDLLAELQKITRKLNKMNKLHSATWKNDAIDAMDLADKND